MTLIDGTLAPTLAILKMISDPGERLKAFTGAIVETGGTIVLPPDDGNNWGPHLVEFSFMGIMATGSTASQAMAEWMKCADRVVQAEVIVQKPPFDADAEQLRKACNIVAVQSRNSSACNAGARLKRAICAGLIQ